MTLLNCNQCGTDYPSSEVRGNIVSSHNWKYLTIEHRCPLCKYPNHTLFQTNQNQVRIRATNGIDETIAEIDRKSTIHARK